MIEIEKPKIETVALNEDGTYGKFRRRTAWSAAMVRRLVTHFVVSYCRPCRGQQ